jgi:hypothetical protein
VKSAQNRIRRLNVTFDKNTEDNVTIHPGFLLPVVPVLCLSGPSVDTKAFFTRGNVMHAIISQTLVGQKIQTRQKTQTFSNDIALKSFVQKYVATHHFSFERLSDSQVNVSFIP